MSEVSKRGWREWVATNRPPKKTAEKVLQNCVALLLRGHRKKGTEKRPQSLAQEGLLRGNPLCPPTPFETFEFSGTQSTVARVRFQPVLLS